MRRWKILLPLLVPTISGLVLAMSPTPAHATPAHATPVQAAPVQAAPVQAAQALPATLTAPRTVWVDIKVNRAWPAKRAVNFVDKYTGTNMRFGKCRKGVACIVIRESWSLPSHYAGYTTVAGTLARVKLNAHRRHTSTANLMHILVHELGHANGIYQHTSRCVAIMYYNINCSNGRLAKLTFTATERRILRRH